MYENEIRKKNPYIEFKEESSLRTFLDELESEDVWERLIPLESVLLSTDSDGLVLKARGNDYPLSEYALYTVQVRAENNAKIINRMNNEEKADILNKSWKHLEGKIGTLLVRGGRAMAFHSGRYRALPQNVIYDRFYNFMRDEFPDAGFEKASYSHDKTEIIINAADANSDILKDFIDMAISCGYSKKQLSLVRAAILLETGDLGKTATRISPVLIDRGRILPIGIGSSVRHRDDAKVSDIEDALSSAGVMITQSLENITRLFSYEIEYPRGCAMNICAKYELPLKNMQFIIDSFDEDGIFGDYTAYDIWSQLTEYLFTPEFMNRSNDRQLLIRQAFTKMTCEKNWKNYDKPLEYR